MIFLHGITVCANGLIFRPGAEFNHNSKGLLLGRRAKGAYSDTQNWSRRQSDLYRLFHAAGQFMTSRMLICFFVDKRFLRDIYCTGFDSASSELKLKDSNLEETAHLARQAAKSNLYFASPTNFSLNSSKEGECNFPSDSFAHPYA